MRKSLLLLVVAMLLPFYALAENMALSKTHTSYTNNNAAGRTETQIYAPYKVAVGHDMPAQQSDSYTLGMWFKMGAYYTLSNTGTSIIRRTVLMRLGTDEHLNFNGNFVLSVDQSGNLIFSGHGGDDQGGAQTAGTFNETKGQTTTVSGVTIGLDTWYHLIFSVDNANNRLALYLDGEKVGEWHTTTPLVYGGTTGWDDGCFGFADYGFTGAVDEIQIWNKGLTDDEAATAHLSATAVAGLTGLYTFDTDACTIPNEAPNAEPGTEGKYQDYIGAQWVADGCVGYNASWASRMHTINLRSSMTLVEGREMGAEDINVTITATPAEGGSLTLTDVENNAFSAAADAQTLQSNTVYTVVATPNAGYQLVKIEKVENGITTAVENNENITFTTDNATITATFSNASAALTIENAGQIPYSVYRGTADVTNQIANLLPGIRYSIVPNVPESKLLLAVKFNGTELTADGTGAYNFEMTDTDATITIESRDKAVYTITVNQPEGGTVTATKGTSDVLASGATVYEGTILTLGAAPNPGYTFVSYLVNGAEYNSTTVTVNANTVISAVFEEGIEYCAPTYASNANSKTSTTTVERGLVSLTLTDGTTTKTFAGNKGANSNTAIYRDYTSDVFNTEAGKTLSFSTVSNPSNATWMHTYIYIDYDRNGLTTSDLLWKNDEVGAALIAITRNEVIPEDLPTGNYRLRFILDWENLDPCYYRGGTNGQGDNGECFIDITLHIEGKTVAERTITVASNNTALGTAAIVGTDETTITSTEAAVAVKATATADGTFMNWTDNNDREVSSEATYNYNGTEDVVLTANFGCSVTTSTSGAAGTIRLTANGSAVQSGNVLPYGTEVTLTCTPGATQRVLSAKLNGEDLTVTNNTVTFTIEKNSTIAVEFADVTFAVNILTQGNGSIRLFNIDWADNMDDFEDAGEILSGDELPDDENVYMVIVPDYNEDGECEELISVVFASGSKTEEWTADDFEGPEDNPIEGLEDVAPMYYSNSLPAYRNILDGEDLTITATFTENLLAIDQVIFAGEEGNTEYFNLQGVKVNAENLTPGIYVARKGGKAVKVLVK